ncbi:MAG: hypothetical protein H0T42_03145 [Deltaproteobacteria bacterium]|nr:hypothetical protein [Deltaproteobacteria bacterium]
MIRYALSLACILIPAIAAAEDRWSHTEDFQPASSASIRVVEPEGYQVTINGRTDSAPAVFAVPNADNYYVMTLRAPSGATWERKLEVRQWKQNVVRVRHGVDTVATPASAPAKYVGVVANTTHLCKKVSDRRDMRIELVLGADIIKSIDVAVRSRVDVELPAGEYRVRQYLRNQDAWELAGTQKHTVSADAWTIHFRCN